MPHFRERRPRLHPFEHICDRTFDASCVHVSSDWFYVRNYPTGVHVRPEKLLAGNPYPMRDE
jgi:hypothetical protein